MSHNISPLAHTLAGIWRRIILIAAITFSAPAAGAVTLTEWLPSDASKPLGSGTEDDPYIIATGANLFWVSYNMAFEDLADKWYAQTGDIDLLGKDWLPIGNSVVGTFTGHYDGRGHVIRGLKLDWSKTARVVNPETGEIIRNITASTPNYYGLFGQFGGTVTNLVIEGAEILQGQLTAAAKSSNDMGMGFLAGAIGDNSLTISNIIVRDSRVIDLGVDSPRFVAPAYMVGGLVGDSHGDLISGTTVSNKVHTIKDIYVDVDVDMSHTILDSSRTYSTKGHQYYVGGIYGRARSLKIASQMPSNTIFTGTINAPLSMIGPIYGAARTNNAAISTYAGYVNAYAGDFGDKPSGTSTASQFDSMYYTDYKVYNYSGGDPVVETITDDNTASHTVDNSLNTRTFVAQQQYTPAADNSENKQIMAMFQGVNRGHYVPSAQPVAAGFDHPGYIWDFTDTHPVMRPEVDLGFTLESVGPFTLRARYATTRPATDGYTIKWYTFPANSADPRQLPETDITASGNTSDLSGFFGGQEVVALLYDGDTVLESCRLYVDPQSFDLRLVNTGYTYTVESSGSSSLPAGYTVTGWSMVDTGGDTYDISHLDGAITPDKRSITIDPSVVSRILCATVERDGLEDIAVWTVVDPVAFDIAYESGVYKPKINNSTDVSAMPFSYVWEARYDGGGAQTITGHTTITPASDFDYPSFNALINLRIVDHYSSVSVTTRYVVDSRVMTITREGDTLVALINGAVPSGGTWEWHGISGDIIDGVTGYELASSSNELVIDRTNDQYNNYYAVWTADGMTSRLIGYYSTRSIIYVYNQTSTRAHGDYDRIVATYPDGNDGNLGRTPHTAVKTIDRAYALLDPKADAVDNIIVVMGYIDEPNTFRMASYLPQNKYKKNATLTGSYGEIIEDGAIFLGSSDNSDASIVGIGGSTIFHDIYISGGGQGHLQFYCNLHDLTFGNNVRMVGYDDIIPDKYGLGSYRAPFVTIVGGFHNYNNRSLDYPESNVTPGRTTIKIQSGCFGRIIAGSRNNYSHPLYNTTSFNTFGHPEWPHRVDVEVAIKHINDMNDYAPGRDKPYTYDIGLLVGGVTDGSIYTDSRIYMASGSVGRFISGNISYGREVGDSHPADGFFGSTEFTMEDGVIGELIGGTLGRNEEKDKTSPKCEAYFYGRSILNLNGGVINNNIYGAGAGGVVGLGTDAYHTEDRFIPYLTGNTVNGNAEVLYAPYGIAKGKLPKIKLHDVDPNLDIDPEDGTHSILDFSKSYVEVNINGGVVKGNVYGGGYGYSANVPVDKALSQAGDVYGDTRVTINGGVVEGSVFGGGAGSGFYFRNPGSEDPNRFTSLANVYGDTHVEITGGIVEGDVFAGGQGIAKLPDMASVIGDTHLLIDQVKESENTWRVPLINGEIYGGSQRGEIIGDTHVEIKGGAIGGNIYGGSQGTLAPADSTMAVIKGNTYLNISGGTYFTDDHCLKISEQHRIDPSNRMFNIYGGGNINCIVAGDTHVDVTQSLFASHRNLLEKEKYPTFADCMYDDTYRKFSIYGAGRGKFTDVTGDTHLNINIEGGASVPSVRPVDVANNQQFIMIAGGGFAGNVYGNTNVTLSGNVFGRRAFGGCMYGRVEGETRINILSGSFHQVYGGGLLGDVMKGSNITIGTKAIPGKENEAAASNRSIYIYDNVYGGNDVGGIVGYERSDIEWTCGHGDHYMIRVYTSEGNVVYYPYSYHIGSDQYGANVKIYGGNVLGSVFGAGNGNHTGYYVPNGAPSDHHDAGFVRMKYADGPAYLYHLDKTDPKYSQRDLMDSESDLYNWGLYEYRPRTNRVRVHIGGNSETDRVRIGESVFAGGHACTVGRFNPQKDVLTDPSRFIGGGTVKMNFGSHVTVGKGVYMGSSGTIVGKQTVTDGDSHSQVVQEADYDYHYYDPVSQRYLLGFPNSVEGRNRFHAYLKLIDMDATTQLTFYDEPAETPGDILPSIDLDDIPDEALVASDVRFGGFYAGGARGSMTYNAPGDGHCYHYILPEGLTVESRVVGGCDDAMVKFYKYSPDYTSYDTDQPMFTYYGGVVYDVNDGGVTGYGGGVVRWHSAPAGTPEKEIIVGNETPRGERVVVKLDVRCQFDPQMSSYVDEDDVTHEVRYGGLVYGGCYNSGITNGSVEVVCTGNLLGSYFESDDFHDYLAWSTLRHNLGRVYGGGFGPDASIRGRTNVVLDGNFRGFNVFGGGMKGDVSRGTNIIVKGLSKVYNAIYGGGMHGNVGLDPITGVVHENNIGTNLRFYSGGIDRVYGGAFMGNVHGGAHITISDEGLPAYSPRLMIGAVYGGNDVTGMVYPDEATDLCADIQMSEAPRADKSSHPLSHKADDGSDTYYSGYPMVGTIYGAGNGNMNDYIAGVTIDREAHEYNGGIIHIANGNKADIDIWDFGQMRSKLPDLETSRISIRGGTVVNAYGGGSMCTVTRRNLVEVNYTDTVARAAFAADNQDPMTWGVLRMFEDLQKEEVTEIIGDYQRFSHQIYRVFGGNNLMDMSIQPSWNLRRGTIFSVYSGGNFGRMTYPEGLTLTIDAPDLRLSSVYGGGRVGDIDARDADGTRLTFAQDKYGATLNISDGIIGDVYGGNNVAGTVYNGTNVNITGAISGNVYGSGNGNYIYLYDYDSSHATLGEETRITEGYNEDYGGRYFILPPKEAYPGKFYGSNPEEKIIAINSYRPNVEKTYLNISGQEERSVFVLGNVFCGGNSSTVLNNPARPASMGDIKFRIGSHVALGGVFLGSNGEGLANPYRILNLANLNGISNLNEPNKIAERPGFGLENKSRLHYRDQGAYDTATYPNILSLYMRAAEVTALPDKIILPEDAVESYIGNFTIGGNYGSMMSDTTINLELPPTLTLLGRVVGGCYNSRVEYNGAVAMGGMVKPLKDGLTDRLNLTVRSRFRPWRIVYDPATRQVCMANNRVDSVGNFVADSEVKAGAKYYYPEGTGNVFGGCYTSGKTIGDINIDIYSDLLGRYVANPNNAPAIGDDPALDTQVNLDMMMNNVELRRTVFGITGAGYGPESVVEGDTRIRLLPQATTGNVTTHPTVCTIFGGSHNGTQIGTSTTEIRDGMVFSSLYASSRAAFKYGSSEVIIGYPGYYRCVTDGIYTLKRADQHSYVARAAAAPTGRYTHPVTGRVYESVNADTSQVIKQSVRYRRGDLVPANVVGEIVGFKLKDSDSPVAINDISAYFTYHRESPADYDSKWDNIDINIGDNSRMNDLDAKFYGGGGIYGGGHAINATAMSFSGINTQLAYTKDNNPDNDSHSSSVGYGGNSSIMIGDNPANTAVDDDGKILYTSTGPVGEAIKDHVSIGTAHYVPVRLDPVTGDKIGHYVRKVDAAGKVTFEHQASGPPQAGVTYYRMESAGGVHGDGRRTFVEKFRAVDVEGYGYADYNPQNAKLINTFQRIDLLSLSDCCLQLQGSTDYATNAVDATLYSVARVGELRLNSSLCGDIEGSVADSSLPGNLRLDSPRTRNYMGFFHNVHYLGAIASSTPMDPIAGDTHKEGEFRGPDGRQTSGTSYRQAKNERIRLYQSLRDTDDPETKTAKNAAFKQRNMATAPNMVGINNGYTLKVQNVFTTKATGATDGILKLEAHDNIYYGPILGVVEVKMLTLAEDEGGGYIYAFNSHSDNIDDDDTTADPGFLEASGNFVYPAAIDESTDNYIVDDCYPVGYYSNPDNRESEEAHYWYVTGHNYYFNATLTGYTFNGPKIDFRLNNADNLILLSGIETSKADKIRVESITWEEHADTGYECAFTRDLDPGEADSRANYQFFMTIDKNTSNEFNLTNVGHAFVAQIPNGNGPSAYGADNGAIRVVNNYSNYAADEPNSPTLGIRLHDTDSNNQSPTFFHNHLEQPDVVVIKIKGEDLEGKENTYTIKLTVNYLQGPYIEGRINVENCALPGEYIYANTSDVVVEMDESLTVTGKHWYLYPRVKDDQAHDIYTWDTSPEGRVDVSRYLMDNITGDANRLQLPARYYQNDWKIGYSIVVNGQDFPLADPDPEHPTNLLTVHNYHRMSTVAQSIKEMTQRHYTTYPFNVDPATYKKTHYGFNIDLDLVGGALVYIEDDEDFAIFTKYINYCNEVRRDESGNVIYHQESGRDVATLVAQVLPGYNQYGHITGFTNGKTIEGYTDSQDVPYRNVKNPSGGENIRFVLNADVKVTDECMPITEFRGYFNGKGHNIYFDETFKGSNFIDVNYGEIHDVGFTSSGGEDSYGLTTSVARVNKGLISNTYYFNYPKGHPEVVTDFSESKYSTLIGENQEEITDDSKVIYRGKADNCYQNTNKANADNIVGVRYRDTRTFHNGMVAFNLNQEYLKARYNSRDNDANVRETMAGLSTQPGLLPIDRLYNYYADGEYRFAYPRSSEHPEGLRLSDNFGVPNYENYMGHGKSMHIVDSLALHDQRRWFKVEGAQIIERDLHGNIIYDSDVRPQTTDEGYFPIYIYDANNELAPYSDFIFFGQRLTTGPQRDYYPRHISYETRVYRSGGYYGSDTDFGFHFNRNIMAMEPKLTAIDFTGYNDLPDTSRPGLSQYAPAWRFHMKGSPAYTDGVYYEQPDDIGYDDILERSENDCLKQLIFYPPAVDLPGGDRNSYLSNILSFDVDTNSDIKHHDKITKNLLVYTPGVGSTINEISEDDNNRLFSMLHYTRMQQWGDFEGETPQERIIGHQLYEVSHASKPQYHFHVANGLFHLVDEQDFNAPIEFYVAHYAEEANTSGRAWMKRRPAAYSSMIESDDPDVFTISKDAWESIALPFTANRVWAVNGDDYIEKYSRGQITHFYGSDPDTGITHHDYWLRGLVDTGADSYAGDDVVASAQFARPGVSTAEEALYEIRDDKGVDQQKRGDYHYYNDWFYNSFKDLAYNENHNEYGDTIVYQQYRYLTKNAPYIVAYPGPDYYEFDLSGEFYNLMHSTTGCHKQEILYEFTVDEIDPNNNLDLEERNVRIPVSDDYNSVRHTRVVGADGTVTTHHATFMLIEGDDITDNMYVLNTDTIKADVAGETVKMLPGSAFINCRDFNITKILPFRTYLTVDLSSPSPGKRFITIGAARGAGGSDPEPGDMDEPSEPETPQEEMSADLRIWVDGQALMVSTSADIQLDIVNMSGQKVRRVNAYTGINRYSGLNPGFYIVGTKKVYIPH